MDSLVATTTPSTSSILLLGGLDCRRRFLHSKWSDKASIPSRFRARRGSRVVSYCCGHTRGTSQDLPLACTSTAYRGKNNNRKTGARNTDIDWLEQPNSPIRNHFPFFFARGWAVFNLRFFKVYSRGFFLTSGNPSSD